MSLNDLSTTPVKDTVDFADLPEQMGGFAPPPQPGPYRWKLSKLGPDNFDKVDGGEYGERVKVKFDQNAPLVITQAPGDAQAVGDPFHTQLTNVPRRRGKGDDAPVASDMDYLLKACKVTARPTTPRAYADALIALSNVATEFGAEIEWSWNCNAKREAQWIGEDGAPYTSNDDAGQPIKGCGKRLYQKDVAKVDGKFPERVACPACGASVRAFANLTRFRE